MDLFTCNWDTAKFLIFSDNVFDPLIYYSHLLPMISALILGFFVFFNNRKELVNRLFLCFTLCFSLWVYFDLILWASEKPEVIMFFWSSLLYVEYAIFVLGFWLAYTFLFRKPVKNIYKILFALFAIPIVFFSNTEYSLIAFSLANCDREPFEGALWSYLYLVEFVISLMTVMISIKYFLESKSSKNKIQNIIFSVGIITFLALFFVGNVVLIYLGASYEQYKLFGMLFFLLLLLFLIVKFKTFNAKILGAQALVWIVLILTASQFFFVENDLSQVLTTITFIFVAIAGYNLVKSVKQADRQKRELEVVNQNQQSLLHFITHQVKGYLTKSRNIFSNMLSGDYGEINEKVREVVQYGFDSETKGVDTVQAILKAADLKTGKSTFSREKTSLSKLVAEVVEKETGLAEKKGLELSFEIEPNIEAMVDSLKMGEVFKNMIENAIIYTSKGEVRVELKKQGDRIRFAVIDTGFGLTEEDMKDLFTEGGRGEDSLSINIDSTGYGLFIAKKIVEQHQGKIGAHSEGRDKGSEFFVILPQMQ